MTFSVKTTYPALPKSGVAKYFQICFLSQNILNRYHWKQCKYKRPTYYTMVTLFDQNRKYYNQNSKIFHLVSHMVLQAVPLIKTAEPSIFVPGSSDRHSQLLKVGNFEII